MLRLRRPEHESRIEIMPLIDVIFLLLTFFIYAMVMLVPLEMLPMPVQQFASGSPADPEPSVVLSIDADGTLYLGREPIELEDVLPALDEMRQEQPGLVVYLAAEEQGIADRLPTFLELFDQLAYAGLDIRLRSAKKDSGSAEPAPE